MLQEKQQHSSTKHLQNETFADVKCVTVNSTPRQGQKTLTRVILVKAVTHPWNRFFFLI